MNKTLALVLCLTIASSSAAADPLELPTMPPLDPAAIDASANACDDFYQYACGGWHEANPMPDDVAFWSRPFTQYAQEMDEYVRVLVENAAQGETGRSRDEAMIGDYYAACMDRKTIEARGLGPLRPELALIHGMRSVDELPAVLGALHRTIPYQPDHGEPGFYIFTWGDPVDGALAARLWISPGGMGLPGRDYYLGDEPDAVALRSDYQAHIAEMLSLLGVSGDVATRQAQQVLDLEAALAQARLPQSVVRNDAAATSNPVTPAELQALTPKFLWADFFRAHGIPQVERVNAREPEWLKAFDHLVTTVPVETWKAYLRWHLVAERASLLPARFQEASFEFYGRRLQGQDSPPNRGRTCFSALERDLPQALGRVFIANAFTGENSLPGLKQQTQEMFEEIRAVMKRRIEGVSWMATETKREALEKLAAVRLQAGSPESWIDDPHLVVRNDDFFGNVQRAGEASRRVHMEALDKPLDPNDWAEPVTWMGGGYDNRRNAIFITAAMLRFYESGADDPAARYGGLGHLLAHELIHAFDPLGRQYDAQGRLRDWWTEADAAGFNARAACVSEQFSQYEYAPGIPVDGEFVVAEQVAELSSWSIAWEAYQRATEGKAQLLNDGYSPAQRYLLTSAQVWCTDATEGRWQALAAGGSSKAWAAPMVHGTVVNLNDFATAFSCKAGDAMVKPPEHRCEVW